MCWIWAAIRWCQGRSVLGTGPLLEGALHVGWDGARQQAVVLMSNTSRVARAAGGSLALAYMS
jgi:hypothetical protein